MNDTITITGNLAADPEMRRTSQGVPVVNFRVGSSVRRFDRAQGTWTDESTNWYSVSAFRGLGQNAFHSLRKGSPVVVSGRLVLRTWDANGTMRTSADIEAEAIGHDLRWGVVTMERQPATEGAAAGEASTGENGEWKVEGATEEWETAALGQANESAAVADGGTAAEAGALVGAGSGLGENASASSGPF
ncbi:single-stranded DNA-binding protein [Microbacterium sp. C7(2022)]|uniref:single-stranded DNA-binding protein n=1 Tax=Microbacterium sp. C7(2022) TaxID=2992759 RepID=UPI00237B08A9|nr:single-stranded DNA-binding protein [Microbacterium sp. C7(2022)]MDE0546946.1 single-stranded DNA-binding protein [Microbacterium sp. C7(2022)]